MIPQPLRLSFRINGFGVTLFFATYSSVLQEADYHQARSCSIFYRCSAQSEGDARGVLQMAGWCGSA